MRPKTETEVFEKIDIGIHRAVAKALLRHKKLGESIVIWRDGKVVEIPPEEINVTEEDAR